MIPGEFRRLRPMIQIHIQRFYSMRGLTVIVATIQYPNPVPPELERPNGDVETPGLTVACDHTWR